MIGGIVGEKSKKIGEKYKGIVVKGWVREKGR